MAYTWVVVADSVRARIFTAETSTSGLAELETMTHPEGRMHDRDITSDLPGRSFDSLGNARHAMEPPTDPKHELAIEFARSLAHHLDAARIKKDFERLVIVAAPAFLGLLREHLNTTCRKLVAFELNKNLTQHTPEDIRNHLPKPLPAL